MGVVSVDKALADASIEQIEAMALADTAKQGSGEAEGVSAEGQVDAASEVEQDVTASSGQAEEQGQAAEGGKKESDKEINFAKLRTKTESLERELEKTREENKRLAERTYVAELPEDHAQKVADVDARLAAIGNEFQEGNLTWDQYQNKLREANVERERLVAAALKAEISKEMREQAEMDAAEAAKKTWEETCENFIASQPDSVDYSADEAKFRDLNTYVKALASDPDNSDKSSEWFLQEAHGLVKAKHRIEGTKPDQAETKPDQRAAHGETRPFHTLSDVPGGVPPAKNEVEQLDQLSGAALTNRFLSDPSQIDKYLASLG